MHTEKISILEDLGKFTVELTAEVEWTDQGVGRFEYFGYIGNHVEIVCEISSDVTWNRKKFTPEQNKEIEEYLEEFRSMIETLIYDKADNVEAPYKKIQN